MKNSPQLVKRRRYDTAFHIPSMAATRGAQLDPATAAELRQLRTTNRQQAQELDI